MFAAKYARFHKKFLSKRWQLASELEADSQAQHNVLERVDSSRTAWCAQLANPKNYYRIGLIDRREKGKKGREQKCRRSNLRAQDWGQQLDIFRVPFKQHHHFRL